jgi:hypothetical protein
MIMRSKVAGRDRRLACAGVHDSEGSSVTLCCPDEDAAVYTSPVITADEALSFVREEGMVLVSARGSLPCLVEVILGEAIRGSWWAHPRSREIFTVLQEVEGSTELLRCRLVGGKITLVHRRLWPALFKLGRRFKRSHLAQTHQEHTSSGKHVSRSVEFPDWVPQWARAEARAMSEREAQQSLARVLM